MLGTAPTERGHDPGSLGSRRRRYLAAGTAAVLLLPVIGVVGAQGAQNWCQGGETTFSNFAVSPSLWPPGVHCSFDVPGEGSVERYWPINW